MAARLRPAYQVIFLSLWFLQPSCPISPSLRWQPCHRSTSQVTDSFLKWKCTGCAVIDRFASHPRNCACHCLMSICRKSGHSKTHTRPLHHSYHSFPPPLLHIIFPFDLCKMHYSLQCPFSITLHNVPAVLEKLHTHQGLPIWRYADLSQRNWYAGWLYLRYFLNCYHRTPETICTVYLFIFKSHILDSLSGNEKFRGFFYVWNKLQANKQTKKTMSDLSAS